MVNDRPTTTRRKFVATGALLMGAGCVSPTDESRDQDDKRTTRTPESTPTATEEPTETATEESTESEPVEDRTTDVEPDVTPAYQGVFIQSGRTVDNFETLDRWTVRKGGTAEVDTDQRFAGRQSLSYEGTGRTVVVGDYRANPIDLTDEDISLAAKFEEPIDVQPTFYVVGEAPDHDNQVLFGTPYDGNKAAGWQRFDLAPIDTDGDPDLTDIRELKLVVNASDDTAVKFNVDDLRAHPKPDSGKIIFRFDDSHERHYTDYFPVLQDHGYSAIEAVVKQSVGHSDRLSVQQLLELQEAGWDLCNHTTKHQNIRHLSDGELRRNVREMNDWFDQYGIEQGTDMHVYTFSAYDGQSLDVLSEHFEMAFGGGGATNYSLTNPLTVNSFNAESGIEETKELLDRVASNRSLAVLMFHDEFSRAEFREIVEHVAANDDRLDVISGSDLKEHVYAQK